MHWNPQDHIKRSGRDERVESVGSQSVQGTSVWIIVRIPVRIVEKSVARGGIRRRRPAHLVIRLGNESRKN
jgi:hypothetical protein